MNNKTKIFEELKKIAIMCNTSVTKEKLTMYSVFLDEKLGEQGVEAASKMIGKSQFFPSVKEIMDNHQPPEDLEATGQALADEIIDSIPRFGYTNEKAAHEHLGPVAWSSVLGMGGWKIVCCTKIADLPTLRAQLRMSCKANTKMSHSDPNKLLAKRRNTLTRLFDDPKLVE